MHTHRWAVNWTQGPDDAKWALFTHKEYGEYTLRGPLGHLLIHGETCNLNLYVLMIISPLPKTKYLPQVLGLYFIGPLGISTLGFSSQNSAQNFQCSIYNLLPNMFLHYLTWDLARPETLVSPLWPHAPLILFFEHLCDLSYSLSSIWWSLMVKALIIPLLNTDDWLTVLILPREWIQATFLNDKRIDDLRNGGRGLLVPWWGLGLYPFSFHCLCHVGIRSFAKQKGTGHRPRLHRSKGYQVDTFISPLVQVVSNGYISSTKLRKLCHKEIWEMQFLVFQRLQNRKTSWRGKHVVGTEWVCL